MSYVEMALIAIGVATLSWLLCGVAVAVMARRRGGGAGPWILLGILLGPIGLYVILKVMHHHCGACQIPVLRGVRHCPSCGEKIPRLEHNPVGPMWSYRRDW